MRKEHNRVVATLTLIMMMITVMLPMSASATPLVLNPIGTFKEEPLNDGTVAGTIDVSLEWEYYHQGNNNYSYDASELPEGLNLNVIGNYGNAKVEITGKAVSHNAVDSCSIEIRFTTRQPFMWWYNYQEETRKFNIEFYDDDAILINRDKIRVLEVYPSIMTNSTANGSNDPSKPNPGDLLYTKLKNNSKYDITSMSLNKFISLRDDINGTYDVVYFGKGTYCRNTVTDTHFGNDITEHRAEKVLEFIDSNQLCIFHNDAFKGASQDGTLSSIPVTVMYNKFNSVRGRANVKEVNGLNDSVFNNLITEYEKYNQRPILQVTQKPQSYHEVGQPIVSHNLTFEYGVYDPDSDIDDLFTVELYIDRNCNSLFENFERVATREIINGEYDTINYSMSQELTGVYFWKLVVTETNGLGAKSEATDVIRVKGDELVINVLQIKPNSDNNANLTSLFNTYGQRPGEFRINVTETTVNEFNSGTPSKHLRDLNGNYDMVILGFADNYSDDREFNTEAIEELDEFIRTKQSVMFTHDSIHYEYNDALTDKFWDDVGQTIRSGRGETAGLIGFGNHSKLRSEYSALNNTYKIGIYQEINPSNEAVLVRPVNSNTITLYPYNLESVPQNQRSVARTHYQWFKLDLEDKDVIPLFNLYKASSGERVQDDAMNNFYTYTKDNITYSGTGHKPGYPEYEIKLFVNTAFKAHAVANKKPIIHIIKPTGNTEHINTTNFDLIFKLTDDYDNKLKYWVDVDYDNDGIYEVNVADGIVVPIDTDDAITHNLANRTTVGQFMIRIKAQETSETGAISILEKEMNCVSTPVIKPNVSFTDQLGNPITSCLIGETININTLVSATGNIAPQQDVAPKYDIDAKYSNGTQVISKINQDVGSFTFYSTDGVNPSPSGISKQETVTINAADPTTLNVNTKTKYSVYGLPDEHSGSGSLLVKEGMVTIYVKDSEGRGVKNVTVKDVDTAIGQTSSAGSFEQRKIVGSHKYSIDLPAGYVLGPNPIKVRRLSDGTEFDEAEVALTGQNNQWEVTFNLALDIGIDAKYYKYNTSVSYLGDDLENRKYYLRCPKGYPAKYVARIEIDEIDGIQVKGIDFMLETKDSDGIIVSSPTNELYAKVKDGLDSLVGSIPTELAGLRQLYSSNDTPDGGTYAGKSYYIVVEVPKANTQSVKISNVILTMEDDSTQVLSLDSEVIFGEPAPPILR